jgi:TetR/AcrR family transcriptional regulator, fatty acid metabolism regulator protein
MDPKELRERAIKDAKCSVILDAARSVFHEKGFWNARVEDIAAAAGFSKPSIYNYYPDKESIILSLAIREFREMTEKIVAAANESQPFIVSIASIIRITLYYFKEHFSMIMDMSDYQRIVSFHCNMSKHTELAEQFKEIPIRILASLRQLIERSQASGELRSALPAAALTTFIASLMQGIHMDWKVKGQIGDIDKTVEQVMDFIKQGAQIGNL